MVKQQNNVSDYDGLEDEAFPPLPPPLSPGLGGGRDDDGDPFANGDEEGDVSKLAEVPAAKRKGVKRPQPKLDSNRLTSERGLPALRTLFDNVQFKGKGHEAENLKLLMQKMENWAHRLFPKLQFEDFIDKVEKLGNKKEVQTCLKRIRLDMPLTHEDFMGEEEVPPESNVFGDSDPFSRGSFDELIHSTPAPMAPMAPSTPAAASSSSSSSPFTSPTASSAPSLTEEQRRRMELNRQRALERRLARQQQQTDSQTIVSSPADGPSNVSSTNDVDASEHHQEEEKKKKKEEEEEKMEEEDLELKAISSNEQQQQQQEADPLSPKNSEPPTETSGDQNLQEPEPEPEPTGSED